MSEVIDEEAREDEPIVYESLQQPSTASGSAGPADSISMTTLTNIPDQALQWDFDILSTQCENKVGICVRILSKYLGEPTGYEIAEAAIRHYSEDIRANMMGPLYHNFDHAVDVLLQVTHFMFVSCAREMLTPIDMLGLGLAALGHDVKHPGLNNAYHVNTQHELAIRYSDTAVLEAHSAAVVATFLRDRHVLNPLPDREFKRIRSVICASILGTDMSVHFKMMERLTAFIEAEPWAAELEAAVLVNSMPSQAKKVLEPEDRKFMCDILLHAADVSNPSRPWEICKKWSDLVVEEFFRQGDQEKIQGLPISPNCNRATSSQSSLSIGFSDFVVKPLFVQLATILPALEDTAIKNLAINRDRWVELKEADTVDNKQASYPSGVAPTPKPMMLLEERPIGNANSAHIMAQTNGLRLSEDELRANATPKGFREQGTALRYKRAGILRSPIQAQKVGKKKSVCKRKTQTGTRLASKCIAAAPDGLLAEHSKDIVTAPSSPNAMEVYLQRVFKWLYDLHQSKGVQTLFFLITVLALIGNGFRYAFLAPSADQIVNFILTACLSLFVTEIILLCFAEKGYMFSTIMAFDITGAASLVLDVPWLHGGRHGSIFAQQATAARGTTRVARAVRLIRFMRFIRLVRMARLMKLLDSTSNGPNGKYDKRRSSNGFSKVQNLSERLPPSDWIPSRTDQAEMGSRLSERLSRRMLLVVLLVLLVVPYFTVAPNTFMPQVQLLRAMGNMTHSQRIAYSKTYKQKFNVLYLRIAGYDYVPRKRDKLDSLRFNERVTFEEEYHGDMINIFNSNNEQIPRKSKVIQNYRSTVREDAENEILLISFISILLVFSSWGFSEIADEIVVRPVDRMLRLISRVARALDVLRRDTHQGDVGADFLEHSIGKISEMLRFGFGTTLSLFGESTYLTNTAAVSALESVQVHAAFAFLDMHNYHDSMRELPGEAMFSYVSVVSHVVHEAVGSYRGGIARSTGNSFLLVWRQSVDSTEKMHAIYDSARESSSDNKRRLRPGWKGLDCPDIAQLNACDLAFKTITRCALDMTHLNLISEKAKDLVSQLHALNFEGGEDDDETTGRRFVSRVYSNLSDALDQVGSLSKQQVLIESKRASRKVERAAAKLEKYGCSLFFASGLHYGSAVETRPAGSNNVFDDYTDCSFTSPNVNLVAKLESVAAGVYGCTMILSGQFVAKLSPAARQLTRQIDKAKLKNTDQPISLYTYDFLPSHSQQYRLWQPIISISELTTMYGFDTSDECNTYLTRFDRALSAYLDGDWAMAYQLLEKVTELHADDPPLQALMSFMASHGNTCPPNWRGYREFA